MFEYRKAYKGTYVFHLHQVSDTLGQGSFDTTYHYEGEIDLVNRYGLLIDWYNGNKIQVIVSKKGAIAMGSDENVIGQFQGDDVQLEYSVVQGTPQVTTHFELSGTKE